MAICPFFAGAASIFLRSFGTMVSGGRGSMNAFCTLGKPLAGTRRDRATGKFPQSPAAAAHGGQPPAVVYWNAIPDQQAKKAAKITPETVQPMGRSSRS